MSARSTRASLSLLVLCLTAQLTGCVALGLSEPDFCNDIGSASLEPWIEKEWVPYCEQLERHLESPQDYKLSELTTFLAGHAEKSEEIKQKLARHDRPERCFSSGAEELKYRRLMTCIAQGDDQAARLSNSFKVRADPWLDEYQLRVKKLRRDLGDAKGLADRTMAKLQGHIDSSTPMDQPELADQLASKLAQLDNDMKFMGGAQTSLEALLAMAAPNPALATTINTSYRPPLTAIIDEHRANAKTYAELLKMRDYLQRASYGVGKPCPDGLKTRVEEKAARPLLTPKMQEMSAGKKVGITELAVVTNDADGFISRETFKGYICAPRRPENQIEGKPQVCAQHFFVIEREKGQDVKKWDAWVLKQVEEGDHTQGVDCGKL